MMESWLPPFYLYAAGRGRANTPAYRHDVSARDTMPQRLLIKHTIAGRGTLYADGIRHEAPPGHIFVIERPGPYIYCYEGDGEPWDFEFVSIAYVHPAGLLPPDLRREPVFDLTPHTALREMLSELIDKRLSPGYTPDLMVSALAYRFFLSYVNVRLHGDGSPHPAAEQLRQQLLGALSEPDFDLGKACRKLGYAPESMIRLFHRAFGAPPGRFLREARLKRACQLLRDPRLKIKEIAELCGFRSANYFARVFHAGMRQTPVEYRRHPDRIRLENFF